LLYKSDVKYYLGSENSRKALQFAISDSISQIIKTLINDLRAAKVLKIDIK